MTDVERLLRTNRPFLTDGGFETWLFFQQGFEAPEFAAIVLMDEQKCDERCADISMVSSTWRQQLKQVSCSIPIRGADALIGVQS